MSNQKRQYTIRLSAEGKRQLEADLKALGLSGEKSLQRIHKAAMPASSGLRETDKAARGLQGGLQSVGRELPALQRLARFFGTTALAGGIVAFGKASLDVGRQFDAAMKRVQAATSATDAELARLREAARDTGERTAFTAMQSADAIEVLAKNGLDVQQILNGALGATVSLAGALGSELAPSADLVTDLMQQFNLEAAQMPALADSVTAAALESKFGFDDLRLAIGQAGGVAGQFGVDVDEFLTALAATASGFASGSDAGTSYKNFLQRLTPQSKQAAAAMDELGLNFYNADGSMKSMVEIVGELERGIAGLSDEARNNALQDIFGTDSIRTALLLANKGASGFSELATAMAEVSAEDQAQVRLEGLDGALKEVAAAWEAVQIASSEAGGLDVAEEVVDRLTKALRYLSENFEEVEEVVERVAQALVVYLVGRGIKLAVAQAISMRAAYVDLATSVTGVGVAAQRSLGPVTRLGVAGRALMGTLGGPLTLAVTAASLLSLGLDLDSTADAVEGVDTAARDAGSALDAYREASRAAADEQANLEGGVTRATRALQEQTRSQLQLSLQDLQRKQKSVSSLAMDELGTAEGEIRDFLSQTPGIVEIVEAMAAVNDGSKSLSELVREFDQLIGVGPEVHEIISALKMDDLEGAGARIRAYYGDLGDIEDALSDVERASGPGARELAVAKLIDLLESAAEAASFLRTDQQQELLGLVRAAAESEQAVEAVMIQLGVLEGRLSDTGGETILSEAVKDSDALNENLKAAAENIRNLDGIYARYQMAGEEGYWQTDRGAYPRNELKAAEKGILDLIGFVEGTDKGRGYNETLGYGAYTGGPVNLINMTLKEVRALQKQMLAHPDNTYNSSAVGRYQIVGQTLQGLMDQFGLSGDELFDEDMQDRLARQLVRGRLGQGKEGFYNEWEGFKKAGTPWSTIQAGLGAQTIAREDPEMARKRIDAEKESDKAQKDHLETVAQLVDIGDERLAQLALESELAGKSVAEQARLTTMYELLAAAKKAGIDPEKEMLENGQLLIDNFRQQAAAAAAAAAENDSWRQTNDANTRSIEESKDAVKSAFDNFKRGGGGIKGFFADIFGFIGDKLWELAFDPLWENLGSSLSGLIPNNSGSGGGGGFWKSVLGIFGLADGGPVPVLPAFAGGGRMQGPAQATGLLPGVGGKRQDNMLFWGSKGEVMQPASAVDYYGVDFMEAVRQRRFPRETFDAYDVGGLLGPVRSARPGGSRDRPGVHLTMSVEEGALFRPVVREESYSAATQVSTVAVKRQSRSLQSRTQELNMRGTTT
jgi:TP901 family phage tail tape measure protein